MRLQGKKDPPSHKTPKVLGPVWIGRQRDLERVRVQSRQSLDQKRRASLA
jgi:hypothetical protein